MLNVTSTSLEQAIARARHAESLSRWQEAQQACEEVLRLAPGNLEAMHLLGVLLFRQGAADRALKLFRNVVAVAPQLPDAWNSLGLALHAMGNVIEAEEAFHTAIRLNPRNGLFRSNLSLALKAQGKLAEAVESCREAVRLAPQFADGYNNLGNALRAAGDLSGAGEAFRQAVTLQPGHAEAWSNLATTLGEQGGATDALHAIDQAIQLKPTNAEFHANRALQLQAMNRTDDTIAACRQAIALGPAFATAHLTLAALLVARGEKEEAGEVLQQAITRFPGIDELRFEMERLSGETRKLPPEMIRALFDHYAPLFESHLVQRLAYRGPELLMNALRTFEPALQPGDILDLGCGTGLCGALFKPLAKRLVGIDLADAMLARAAARNIYDELLQGDLAPLMAARPAQFDLLLAADVFEYIGDLEDVFAAARTTLRPGALFAFTAEKSADTPLLYQEATRRFAHSRDYLLTLAARHGFTLLHIEEQTLRIERQKPLPAWIAVLRKSR